MSDEEWISLVREGCPVADRWRQLIHEQVRVNGRLLFAVAYRILHERQASEDACQQALVKAWEHRQRIREAGALRKWLVQTVINESLQMLRRRRKDDQLHRMHFASKGSEQPGVAMELHESVHAGLEQLAEPTRTIVVLRVMQGMPGEQVKLVVGCSASEVSRRLHAGMEQLRETFMAADEPSGVQGR
jgi:RNA polymerase sigma-70 factor (ECF subfamily)